MDFVDELPRNATGNILQRDLRESSWRGHDRNIQQFRHDGGSRGLGLAIAERAARDGANGVLIARTVSPDPRLEGTIHTAAAAIEAAGGQVLAVVGDVRDDDTIALAVAQAVGRFGGIDIVVNNAGVISLDGTLNVSPKRYDLMQDVNVRAVSCCPSRHCRTCSRR